MWNQVSSAASFYFRDSKFEDFQSKFRRFVRLWKSWRYYWTIYTILVVIRLFLQSQKYKSLILWNWAEIATSLARENQAEENDAKMSNFEHDRVSKNKSCAFGKELLEVFEAKHISVIIDGTHAGHGKSEISVVFIVNRYCLSCWMFLVLPPREIFSRPPPPYA